ncbi:MAG: hypothetical protein UV04_C0032G0013 [Candidatus Gottesmanbacteria bacterium GW2011_GWA2_42_16]|nr:MAG: hypothetical protein UV04_C0032G0013 [Candidatus Gottesmanbacteria bacterium GW2011_GWA2_42_16]
MKWIELRNMQPINGALNEHIPLLGERHENALLRVPHENTDLFRSIYFEYKFLGFIEVGGRFRKRNPSEQYEFTRKAAETGLRVLPPLDKKGTDLVYHFFPTAKTLDVFLSDSETKEANTVIYQLIEDLFSAHSKGVVYGDRWSRNILIVPEYGALHIDFDLEISGPYAREFEVAQLAYYALSGGKEKVMFTLAQLLGSRHDWFNFSMVEKFMNGHARYFNNTPYGGIQNQTEIFLTLLSDSMHKKSKST